MTYATQTSDVSFDWGPTTVTTVVFALLIGFWSSVGLESIGVEVQLVQAILGVVLLSIVPGGLVAQLLGLRTNSAGEFATVALGLSLAVLSITTVLSSVLLPVFGVSEPLSFLPLSVIVTALITLLMLLVLITNGTSLRVRVPVSSMLVSVLIGLLPVSAVLGALAMNRYGVSVGLGLFVVVVAVVTILSATRVIDPPQYPAVVFSVALSTILHRSLAASHVVGADIQFTFFLSELFASSHRWIPDVGGSISSLPIVTAVPVAFSMVTGLELVTVFIVVYPIVFSFVPLGIYYLTSDVFDDTVALYGSLFFVFYHGTFYLTPGKQRLSELFIVGLLLLYFRYERRDWGGAVAAVLLAIGLVHSHYGSTYVFGLSFLAASVGLVLAERFFGEFRHGFSPIYPIAFLAGATSWYAYASGELIASLASIPVSVLGQIAALPEGVAGSGSSYVTAQQTVFQQVSLGLYLLLSLLLCLGLVWQTIVSLGRIRRGTDTGTGFAEYTALALPLCAFLGTSYFLILNLWADRVYQMVLPVLAGFAAVGYLLLGTTAERLPGLSGVNWTPFAVALAALFVINSGLAGAAAGTPTDYTFDEDAHDYAFSDDEHEAAHWLEEQPGIKRTGTVNGTENESVVPIYTDRITSQLFRSVLPESHYNVKIIMVKNKWNRTFDPAETRGGYVFIRHSAIENADPDDTALASLSDDHVDEIIDNRTIAYENDDVTIVEPVNGSTANATDGES